MALIPTIDSTANRIEAVNIPEKEDLLKFLAEVGEIIKEKAEDDNDRGYLGMSSIGDPCMRKLWYGFHMAKPREKPSARALRIFNTGHIAEGFMIKDLKAVGIQVYGQQEECSAVAGHFKGHIDGKLLGVIEAEKTEHLAEFKTHNDKSFNALIKAGSVEKSKPVHYAQMQVYMKYQKLTRALYVAYNKNTSQYYFERVYYNEDHANDLVHKATEIIMSEVAPVKEFGPTWYACKWCNFYDICHNGDMPSKNCRTCAEVDICDDGKWECGMNGQELSIEEQKAGCEYHKFGWGL